MFRELRIPFFTILFLFLGLFLYSKIAGPIPFFINSVTTVKQNLFTVQGVGEATAVPDTALLQLGVTKNATTIEDAQNQVNTIINQVTKDLKNLGVEEKNIKTTNYSVNPNYDYTAGRERINGYNVSANIEVRVKPVDKANQAIDIATRDGANQVGGIQFVLDDEDREKLENQARSEAIQKAKAKAQSISNAAGIRLGRIVDIQESGGGVPMPFDLKAQETTLPRGGAPTELNPGENKITVNISLSYETF